MNSTATDLVLKKGAVSASMLAEGGPGLQVECKSKYPQGIKVWEVAETAGHGLRCRVVYHLAMCPWSNPQAAQVHYSDSSFSSPAISPHFSPTQSVPSLVKRRIYSSTRLHHSTHRIHLPTPNKVCPFFLFFIFSHLLII